MSGDMVPREVLRPASGVPLIPDARSSAVAGCLSAAVSTFATHPLDLVKTRLQVQAALHHGSVTPGLIGSLRNVIRDEGPRALFSGITPALLGLGPALAVFFSSYNFLKTKVSPHPQFAHHHTFDPTVPAIAASGAWVITSLVTNPLWIVKVRLQTQTMDELGRPCTGRPPDRAVYRGVFHALREIVRQEGVLGLFQGGFAACLGFPSVMLKFPLYEWLKLTDDGAAPGLAQLAVASSTAASISTAAFYPLEVIRSRMQRQRRGIDQLYTSPAQCFLHMRRNEGYASFYRGLRVSLVRTVPNAIVALCSYEVILRMLPNTRQQVQDG